MSLARCISIYAWILQIKEQCVSRQNQLLGFELLLGFYFQQASRNKCEWSNKGTGKRAHFSRILGGAFGESFTSYKEGDCQTDAADDAGDYQFPCAYTGGQGEPKGFRQPRKS